MATGLDREVPTTEVNGNYLNASVMFPGGNRYAREKVIERKRDADGNAVIRTNNNPILYTREHRVDFDDGEVSELTANVISECMYAACDDYGNDHLMMDSIVDYQKSDKAISVTNQKVLHRGWRFMPRSTFGWQLCVQFIDGLTSWQALKYFKESHSVETAEYDVAEEIYHAPEFNLWVNTVLKIWLRIISLCQ